MNFFGRLFFFISICIFIPSFFFISHIYATVYLSKISDLLSTSAPSSETNQKIRFTLNQAIPANGAIEIYFDRGGFSIPSTLNYTDVDVAFGAVYGGPYTDRPLSSVQSAGTDDITVTSGTTGKIRIDLNTTVGIPAGNEVVVEVGTNATYGSIGDVRARLASTTGSYPVTIRTFNTSDIELDFGRTMVAVVEQVTAGPVDTTDQTPPVILSAEPTGILQVGTRGVEMFITTDEYTSCRYATSSMAYALMPYSFTGTSTGMNLWHFAQVTGLEDDTDYTYYLRCIDYRLNEIDPDYILNFTIGIAPDGASVQDGPGTGDDVGTGGGSTGSGSGSSSNGGDGGGGSSSGGGEDGTKLPQADVRIDGWAYPSSNISFVKDGVLLTTKSAGSVGEFSYLIEGSDRGSYTFGLYAVDSEGGRSATYSSTLWLRPDTLNILGNVMLPPTIHAAEASLDPGTSLVLHGYSAPYAVITTWLRPKLAEVSSSDIVATSTAGSNGKWSLTIPTAGLSNGTYELVAQGKMKDGLVESDKSARKTIGIGVSVPDGDCVSMGDLNCDTLVNLVDFSILLFNWNKPSDIADVNADGIVSLPDFSIMLYNWTG